MQAKNSPSLLVLYSLYTSRETDDGYKDYSARTVLGVKQYIRYNINPMEYNIILLAALIVGDATTKNGFNKIDSQSIK